MNNMGKQKVSCLDNYEAYYQYADFARYPKKPFVVNVSTINLDNYYEHLTGIFNLILDGIDEPIITQKHIRIQFSSGKGCNLSTIDYWYNLIMWYALLRVGIKIQPAHVFFDFNCLTQSTIKNFIDDYVIEYGKKKFSVKDINIIINDTLENFGGVDEFSFYLMNTINLKDDIDLMNANREYYDLLHADLSNVPIEDNKKVGMDLTHKAINIIKRSGEWLENEHCLADSFRSKQGINERQYKEFNFNIGTKPKGDEEVWPVPINHSYTNGGVGDPIDYTIDASTGRIAQMLSKINVADSGGFARLLSLNNIDTWLNQDRNYICSTKNFIKIEVKNMEILKLLRGKFYRTNPNGMEYMIGKSSTNLIGKTIYLRSPMTCDSKAKGRGVCYRCYGDLAYTNNNINIGKMAADILSSKLTQRLLSAKHLIETVIKKVLWSIQFDRFFFVEGNAIKLLDDIDLKDWDMIIDPDSIEIVSEDYSSSYDDDGDRNQGNMYNEYIKSFIIENKRGESYEIHTEYYDKLYITSELNSLIRKKAINKDGKLSMPMKDMTDIYLFFIAIHNNELSKTMDQLVDIINKASVTKTKNKDELLQSFLDTVVEGGLYINSTHCEIILSNQLRDIENILDNPDWGLPNATYQVLTLNNALTDNPSVIISLMYQRLSQTLYNPLTFKKSGASFLDLFFMENPTEYLNAEEVKPAPSKKDDISNRSIPFIKYGKRYNDDEDFEEIPID